MSEKFLQFKGGKFLKEKYWERKEFRKTVEGTVRKRSRQEGEKIPHKPEKQIILHLERIKNIVEKKGRFFLKTSLYPRLIIKPENFSDNYIRNVLFDNFARLMGYNKEQFENPQIREQIINLFEREYGQDFSKTEEREQIIEQTIQNQKISLDYWFEYLTGPEGEYYPDFFKYWTFVEITKLGVFDRENKKFTQRTKKTVAPFPELNHQALAIVLNELLVKHTGTSFYLKLSEIQKKEFQEYLISKNFGKLYAWALDYVYSLKLPEERLSITIGEWQKFAQGSNAQKLVDAIKDYPTGWCINTFVLAESYLKNNDAWIYFSQNSEGKNTIPRVIIVHNNFEIDQVSGILKDQCLDSYILPIVDEKIKNLSGGEKWQKKMKNMRRLAAIHFKYLEGYSLTQEELRFIYEIDYPIEGMSHRKDPRLNEILKKRNPKKDLAFIFNISENYISVTEKEALQGNILFHYGNLFLKHFKSAEGLILPKKIGGNLYLDNLELAKGLTLPEKINGDLYFRSLKSTEGLILPKEIGGDLYFDDLKSAKGLILPEKIGGALSFSSLESAEGLILPKKIAGGLYFRNLKSAKGLILSEKINGTIFLSSLESAEGLILPKEINGNLYLRSLKSAKGLILPEKINGDLFLNNLESAEGLILPKEINGDLDLRSLKLTKGLILSEKINGTIFLSSLESAEGLILPKEINGDLDLRSLKLAKGLILPEKINGDLFLNNLESAEELILPKKIAGGLYFRKLKLTEINRLKKEYSNLMIIIS